MRFARYRGACFTNQINVESPKGIRPKGKNDPANGLNPSCILLFLRREVGFAHQLFLSSFFLLRARPN